MIGISIKPTIGIGDALQYSSLPENYFKATGKKLLDVSRPWFFDYNPYMDRSGVTPSKTTEMWNFSPKQYDWPIPRKNGPHVYLSNAEIWASVFKVPCTLNRPRLYRFEDYPYSSRDYIVLQTRGRSHGLLDQKIIDHVVKKYGAGNLIHIGPFERAEGLYHQETPTLWDLAELISKAKMFIGLDSGPAWIAACYPDVISKKVRTKPTPDYFKEWQPLEIGNIHSHWDDRCHQIFNTTEEDVGFTSTYLKL